MKLPAGYILVYCEYCDGYTHDITDCLTYHLVMKSFKDKAKILRTARFEKCKTTQEVEEIEASVGKEINKP